MVFNAAWRCRKKPGRRSPSPRAVRGRASIVTSAQRVQSNQACASPANVLWAIYRQNLDGSEPRYYLSNAPEDTPLETLAYVGGSRWRIETPVRDREERRGTGRVRDSYLGRLAPPHHHVPVGRGFPVEACNRIGGRKDAPDHQYPRCTEWCVSYCPKQRFGP